jgi:enterochelin esterase family protein
MAKLSVDVRTNRASAVAQFWSDVQIQGSPFFESIDGTDDAILATVVWKATYDTRNVLVLWPPGVSVDEYMSHVAGTDIWFQTVRVRTDSRFTYFLAPNYRDGDLKMGGPTFQHDPRNPRSNLARHGSVLEAPGAPDDYWARRVPTITGEVTKHQFDSKLLGAKRDISIYTPPQYNPSAGPYALLILFDGHAYARQPAIAESGNDTRFRIGGLAALDNLLAAHKIRPTIACLIEPGPDGRSADFRRQEYRDAIALELVPWIRASYSVSTEPRDAVIGGYSAGAGAAALIAFKHSDLFGNVLLQSGGGGQVQAALEAPAARLRFYYDVGAYEDASIQQPSPSQRFREALEAKGYEVIHKETGGEHGDVHWRGTLPQALMALLPPR